MGSPLGLLIANVFMTELEKDTLLLVKDEDIDLILKELNSYNKNIIFTVGCFTNKDVHFLDIKIHQNNTDTYYKDTHTGQYFKYHSQTP